MSFTRNGDPLDTLKIGKRQMLEIVSSGTLIIGSHKSSLRLVERGFCTGKGVEELLKRLETGKIGKKFIINLCHNVDRHKMEQGDHIRFHFNIKPENRKGEDAWRYSGEFIYEHDDKIYNIPEEIELVDDLWFSFKPWNVKRLSCELRKAKVRY